jgi:hypothetical protein
MKETRAGLDTGEGEDMSLLANVRVHGEGEDVRYCTWPGGVVDGGFLIGKPPLCCPPSYRVPVTKKKGPFVWHQALPEP